MAQPQLGWIGLGAMGIGMSKNLQKHLASTGAPALVYTNRTLSRGDSLKELGAVPAETVGEVVKKSDIIFSCVSNDAVLQETAKEIIAAGIKGKVWADCTTVHPDTTAAIAKLITEAGGEFVAAPVFGAAPVAAAGNLIFTTAGPESATSRIAPYIVGVMGKAEIPMGTEVSRSSLLKIAGNICVVSFMEVISEAQVFAEKTGLGTDVLESMIGNNFGPVLESYSKRLTTGIYAPAPGEKAGFDVHLAMKDARHAIKCAGDVGMRLETSELALKHLEEAVEHVGPERSLDSSSMYGIIRKGAGLDFYTDLCKERDEKVKKSSE